MEHVDLIAEEGRGVDGTAPEVCPGTVDELRPASPVPGIGAMCVAVSIQRSLLQAVAYVPWIVP